MDHMMPEMDGIEAVRIIRAWEKDVPIVALTANALAGNMEMFLSKGFNGFIPKPIDIVQLDKVLNQWVRDKQTQETLQQSEKERKEIIPMNDDKQTTLLINIPGLDVKKGLALSGGKVENYRQVLIMFCKDIEDRLPIFQTVPEPDTLQSFVIQVHALKSASGSIGADEVSSLAADLEAAGRAEDLVLIQNKLPVFAEQLEELIKNIKPILENWEAENQSALHSLASIPHSLLKELEAALESYNGNEISRILEEIDEASHEQPLDPKTKEAIEQISDEVMMAEYSNAKKIVKELIEALYGE
jgi:HPt (histidine-containing phosphotransfer) domain-containing protein